MLLNGGGEYGRNKGDYAKVRYDDAKRSNVKCYDAFSYF